MDESSASRKWHVSGSNNQPLGGSLLPVAIISKWPLAIYKCETLAEMSRRVVFANMLEKTFLLDTAKAFALCWKSYKLRANILSFLFLIFFAVIFLTNLSNAFDLSGLGADPIGQQIQSAIIAAEQILGLLIIFLIIFAALFYAAGQMLGAETRARASVYLSNIIFAIFVAALLYILTPYIFDLLTLNIASQLSGPLEWRLYAIGIAFLSVIISGMAFIFAKVFEMRQLEQSAKSELVFAVSTVLLVMFIVFFLENSEKFLTDTGWKMFTATYARSYIGALGPPTNYNLIDMAKLYLNPANSCILTAMRSLRVISFVAEPLTSVYLEIFMSEVASGFAFKFITERINNLAQIMVFYRWASFVMIHTLNFIQSYGTFFIAFGVILRAFPLTRGAGAYMIALSLGLYLIFPAVYVLSSAISTSYTFDRDTVSACIDSAGNPVAGCDIKDTKNYLCSLPAIPQNVQFDGISASNAEKMLNWFGAQRDNLDSFFSYVSGPLVKSMSIVICFLPIISLTLTLSFVLSTTSLFGGQIPEVGRGLIKLI